MSNTRRKPAARPTHREAPVTVTVPLPPAALSPNARVHWAAKAKATRAYRATAWITAVAELGVRRGPRWPHATALITFAYPTNRRRDADNALASLKAAIDGLRDAGIVEDDAGIAFEPVRFTAPPPPDYPRGCVTISIRPRA